MVKYGDATDVKVSHAVFEIVNVEISFIFSVTVRNNSVGSGPAWDASGT